MDINPTICEEKLTSNPNRKGEFIEKQSRHYSISVLLNHHQDYEGLYLDELTDRRLCTILLMSGDVF